MLANIDALAAHSAHSLGIRAPIYASFTTLRCFRAANLRCSSLAHRRQLARGV